MVNMIGFHHREPIYNTSSYGEDGFYILSLDRPTAKYPDRKIMCSPTARLLLNDIDEARLYTNHPGNIPHLAKEYIKILS